MEWYKELYISSGALKKNKKIKWNIEHGVGMLDTYLITLPENKENLLEILPSWNLQSKYIKKNCPMIVGLATGYEEALELITIIIMEVYRNTGNFQIKEYLNISDKNKQR